MNSSQPKLYFHKTKVLQKAQNERRECHSRCQSFEQYAQGKIFGEDDAEHDSCLSNNEILSKNLLKCQIKSQDHNESTPSNQKDSQNNQTIIKKESNENTNSITRNSCYNILSYQQKAHLVSQLSFKSIAEVAREYNVSVNNLCRWKKSCQRRKGAGRKVKDMSMEKALIDWICFRLTHNDLAEKLISNHSTTSSQVKFEDCFENQFNRPSYNTQTTYPKFLTRKDVQEKAKQLAKSHSFKASKGWFQRLSKRHSNVFRQVAQDGKLHIVLSNGVNSHKNFKFFKNQEDSSEIKEEDSEIVNHSKPIKKYYQQKKVNQHHLMTPHVSEQHSLHSWLQQRQMAYDILDFEEEQVDGMIKMEMDQFEDQNEFKSANQYPQMIEESSSQQQFFIENGQSPNIHQDYLNESEAKTKHQQLMNINALLLNMDSEFIAYRSKK